MNCVWSQDIRKALEFTFGIILLPLWGIININIMIFCAAALHYEKRFINTLDLTFDYIQQILFFHSKQATKYMYKSP